MGESEVPALPEIMMRIGAHRHIADTDATVRLDQTANADRQTALGGTP